MSSLINVTGVLQDEGSIVVFEGFDHDTDEPVTFAVDHRPAQGLASVVLNGEFTLARVEEWQILSRRPAQRPRPLDTATSGAVSDWLDDHGVPEDAR